MNIGIIVFSRTGNTMQVAEKLRNAVETFEHTAAIQRVHAQDEDPNSKQSVRLTDAPDPSGFDRVVFCGPVQGFALTGIMKNYMAQLPRMDGKQVELLVTQHFPKAWMGGRQALTYMRKRCLEKGAEVIAEGNVNWMNKARGTQIDTVVAALAERMGTAL